MKIKINKMEIEVEATTSGYVAKHPDQSVTAYGVTSLDAARKMAKFREDRETQHAPEEHFDRLARLEKSAKALE